MALYTKMVRQPTTFVYGNEFSPWMKQFNNFATAMACSKANKYPLFLTYLDTKYFQIIQNLELGDDLKADMDLAADNIATALSTDADKLPARLSLKYRM